MRNPSFVLAWCTFFLCIAFFARGRNHPKTSSSSATSTPPPPAAPQLCSRLCAAPLLLFLFDMHAVTVPAPSTNAASVVQQATHRCSKRSTFTSLPQVSIVHICSRELGLLCRSPAHRGRANAAPRTVRRSEDEGSAESLVGIVAAAPAGLLRPVSTEPAGARSDDPPCRPRRYSQSWRQPKSSARYWQKCLPR